MSGRGRESQIDSERAPPLLAILCQKKPDEVCEVVVERGRRYRRLARGYALGTGNSIRDYVPVEGYLAMIRAARRLREEERNPCP